VTKKEITGWKRTAYVKPITSITFTQISKRHIPDININNLEKTNKKIGYCIGCGICFESKTWNGCPRLQ